MSKFEDAARVISLDPSEPCEKADSDPSDLKL